MNVPDNIESRLKILKADHPVLHRDLSSLNSRARPRRLIELSSMGLAIEQGQLLYNSGTREVTEQPCANMEETPIEPRLKISKADHPVLHRALSSLNSRARPRRLIGLAVMGWALEQGQILSHGNRPVQAAASVLPHNPGSGEAAGQTGTKGEAAPAGLEPEKNYLLSAENGAVISELFDKLFDPIDS